MMEIIFIVSFLIPLVILLYPISSFIRYYFFSIPILKSNNYLTPVSIIIACYNEELYIRSKLESLLNKDEWIEGSEIIVVSGGSSDKTNLILSDFEKYPSVRIVINPTRLSKITAVNLAVDMSKNELLVFSDCRQYMTKGSIRELIHNFNDQTIGTVSALLSDQRKTKKQSFFRYILNKLAYYDCQSGSSFTIYGALYAQRKSVFRKFPEDQLFDDLCVIANTLSQNKRLIIEPKAVIYDVNFQTYYGRERLERLTRGLLVFINKQWSVLTTIGFWNLYRFLVLKYAKLLLPFSIVTWIILFAIYSITTFDLFVMLIIFIISISLILPKIRNFITFCFRINTYFLIAFLQFFFLKKQSIKWEKLVVEDKILN